MSCITTLNDKRHYKYKHIVLPAIKHSWIYLKLKKVNMPLCNVHINKNRLTISTFWKLHLHEGTQGRLAGLQWCLLWVCVSVPCCHLNFTDIMALHVPRAPGFSSMLKDGARVCISLVHRLGCISQFKERQERQWQAAAWRVLVAA